MLLKLFPVSVWHTCVLEHFTVKEWWKGPKSFRAWSDLWLMRKRILAKVIQTKKGFPNKFWHWTYVTAVHTDGVSLVTRRNINRCSFNCIRSPKYSSASIHEKNITYPNSKLTCWVVRCHDNDLLCFQSFFFYVLRPSHGASLIPPPTDNTSVVYPLPPLHSHFLFGKLSKDLF